MELFEEALRRWEQALTFRNRQVEDEANCSSIKLGAGDAIAEESVEVSEWWWMFAVLSHRCALILNDFQSVLQLPVKKLKFRL